MLSTTIMPLDVKMRIDGVLYDQVETTDLIKGDRVFDTNDNCHGIVDMIHPDGKHIAIRDGWAVELGVPMTRVRKLIPSTI